MAELKAGASRLLGLDVLRGFAAVAVMLHHHGQYYDVLYPGRTPLPVNFFPGHFGVELFFIISGFVVLMTIERKRTVASFAAARVARLMPCFLVALVLATCILAVAPMPPLDTPTVRRFLANLTMGPLLLGERVIDLPYWTLNYELVFYILMALVLWWGRLRSIEWICLGWMATNLLYGALVDPLAHNRLTIVLMTYYCNFFTIGICLYIAHADRARTITWVTLAAAVAYSVRGGGPQTFNASSLLYLAVTCAFALAVWFAATPKGRRFAWRPLVFLGRVSYPLYLIHAVVGFEIIRLGQGWGWSTATGVGVAGAVSLIAAVLLHYLVEAPGQRLLRTTVQPRARPRASSSEMPAAALAASDPAVTDSEIAGTD